MLAPRPMPDVPGRVWSESEWQRIQLGYRAASMDEKWTIYAEDDRLFLHRSWTGYLMYEATFAKVDGGGWRITSALVESDPERYRSASADYDRITLELVISAVLLDERAEDLRTRMAAALRTDMSSTAAAAAQHSVLGVRTPQTATRPHHP
ncbi:hypothetical protein ACFCVY_24170 [Streptomyces sp. NPDC056411]|uniref:hypothetical protein n=1 Tax=Streptomyces sp. NPDC056411 TaxID=3345813 RepID=UPI0035E18FDF